MVIVFGGDGVAANFMSLLDAFLTFEVIYALEFNASAKL